MAVETHSLVEGISEMVVTDGITTIDLTRPQQTIDGKWYVAVKKNAQGCPRTEKVEAVGIITFPPNVVYELKTKAEKK